jgi:hypothetical protein
LRDLLMDACIETSDWTNALEQGFAVLEPYR